MKRVPEAMGVSCSHLPTPLLLDLAGGMPRPRGAAARLNSERPDVRVNHRRVWRLMKQACLRFMRYGPKPNLAHEDTVITMASDFRLGSDMFELPCWDSERVHVASSLDFHDREVIASIAPDCWDVGDLVATSMGARLGVLQAPRPLESLSANGPPHMVTEHRDFGRQCGR